MNTKKITFKTLKYLNSCVNNIFKVAVAVILVFSIATNLKAQTIQLFNDHGPVANGTALTFSDTFNVTMIEAHIWVHNTDNRSHDIRCKKILTDTIVGSSNFFCWGACIGANQYISDPLTIAGGDTNKYDFSGDYMPNQHAGTSIITYVFFDDANNNDSAWFVAHYNAFDPNSIIINSESISKNLISLRSNVVNDNISIKINNLYDLNNLFIRIIDITGSTIREIPLKLENDNVLLDVSFLKQGMYFISVSDNTKKYQTLKFIKQ